MAEHSWLQKTTQDTVLRESSVSQATVQGYLKESVKMGQVPGARVVSYPAWVLTSADPLGEQVLLL